MTLALMLIVDDDAAIVSLLEEALEERGYRVVTTVGAAALQVAHELHPAVMLLELMMPGMDGSEVSRRRRRGTR